MSNAMQAGVSGLKVHQTMIDVAGNNLANMNTAGFKSSSVTFQELLSETMKDASASTSLLGGTNPMQVGSGVCVGSINRDMSNGTIEQSSSTLDMAIEGAGYFTLSTGLGDTYTRVGNFAVDADYYLVDPATGYRVQRIGNEGVAEGFQDPTSNNIRIPYDVALPACTTEEISFAGNLSGNQVEPTANLLSSDTKYTTGGGTVASRTTPLDEIDQLSGTLEAGDTITYEGTRKDGSTFNATYTYAAGDTMGTVLDHMESTMNVAPDTKTTSAKVINGEIRLEDTEAGYSRSFISSMEFTDASGGTTELEMPQQFTTLIAGGAVEKTVNVEIFDTQGNSYTLAGSFVKRDDYENTWDFVVKEVGGNTTIHDRRIEGITFLTNGAFGDMHSVCGDPDGLNLELEFNDSDPGNIRNIRLNMGTLGELDGLTQYGGASTASSSGQDGYAAGSLSTLDISREGTLVGVFTNGIRKDIASLKIATFQNPAGLLSEGGNYYAPTANSGDAVCNRATEGSAGIVQGGAIEKSNVEVAAEFVNLIEAQNGYQANARTITVANEMLQELTQLI